VCHPDGPTDSAAAHRREEVLIPVEGGEELPALLVLPAQTPAATILIVNDAFGRSPFYEALAGRLADAGFAALDPEYFFREGPLPEPTFDQAMARMGRVDQRRTLRDLGAAIDWIGGHEWAGGRVGTIGFCGGGTMVLSLTAERADIGATVAYYGFPKSRHLTPLSAPEPLAIADQLRGPILGHWGDGDTGVGIENVEELRSRLADAGVDADLRIYPGVGHGFLKSFLAEEGSEGHAQARDAWALTLDFLHRHLDQPAG
jgi:dienelactone hydrolase